MTEFGTDGLPLIMRWDNCSDISYKSLTHAVDMDAQPLWNGEYYVALDDVGEAAALNAILARFEAVAAARGGHGVNRDIWIHTRYVGGSTASLLDPCYGLAVCAAFELSLVASDMASPLPPWDEWAAYFAAMEDVLADLYGGRPHHAKFSTPGRAPATPAFGLPVREFRAQCAKFDPARLQRNEAFDRRFAGSGDGVFGGPPAPAPAAANDEL